MKRHNSERGQRATWQTARALGFAMAAIAVAAILVQLFPFPPNFYTVKEATNHVLIFFLGMFGLQILERTFIWAEIRESIGKEIGIAFGANDRLVKSAKECGVTAFYTDREAASADVRSSIASAEKRIWLLGISLTRHVALNDLLFDLVKKKSNGVEVKILMMDPLCSPAVFRTLLESHLAEVAALQLSLKSEAPLEPHKAGALFRDVQKAAITVSRAQYARLHPCVKFMAHSAICWMVLTDDVMYYQPYSFGRGQTGEEKDTIGPNFPVLRIENHGVGSKPSYPFDVLEDHFRKVWCTSTTTLDAMRERINQTDSTLKEVADRRREWLEHACAELHMDAKVKYRKKNAGPNASPNRQS